MGLGSLSVVAKAVCGLKLKSVTRQLFLERTLCARPYRVTGHSAGNNINAGLTSGALHSGG